MDFGTRLRNLRLSLGITQIELGERLGLSGVSIANYEAGRRMPSYDILIAAASLFNVSIDYLVGRTDTPYDSASDLTSIVRLSPDSNHKAIRVQVAGYIRGGEPILTDENFLGYEEMIVPTSASADDYIGLKVDGDSMTPAIPEGSIVIIKRQPTCNNGDICAVRVNGDSATVKHVKILPDGMYLIPENSAYSPKFFTAHEVETLPVEIIGKVIEVRIKL